jgi:hypothetical protein
MRRAVVPLLIAVVAVGACQDQIDTGDAEQKIHRSIVELYPKAAVGDLHCPKPDGDTLTCDTTLQGAPVKASVTFDDKGDYDTVTLDKAVIDTQTAQQTIPGQILSDTGGQRVTIDCGPQPYLIGAVGDTFSCTVSGAPSPVRLMITVTDVHGGLTTQLLPL